MKMEKSEVCLDENKEILEQMPTKTTEVSQKKRFQHQKERSIIQFEMALKKIMKREAREA